MANSWEAQTDVPGPKDGNCQAAKMVARVRAQRTRSVPLLRCGRSLRDVVSAAGQPIHVPNMYRVGTPRFTAQPSRALL